MDNTCRHLYLPAVSRKVVQQKRTRQCRKVLRVMGFLVLDWGFRCFSNIEGNSTNKCIYAFSFLVGEHPWTSINQRQNRSTHDTNPHCRVRFYGFVGQPLSKQLYVSRGAIFPSADWAKGAKPPSLGVAVWNDNVQSLKFVVCNFPGAVRTDAARKTRAMHIFKHLPAVRLG